MFDNDSETYFMFPERCSLGVVEGNVNDSLVPRRFSILELDLDQNDDDQFEEIFNLVRRSHSIRITHMPYPIQNPPDELKNDSTRTSSLIISFHSSGENQDEWDSPLVAAVISLDPLTNLKDLSNFNDYIVRMESLGLSLAFGHDMTILMLLELQAIGESLFDLMPEKIGNLIFSPVYYAEFQPRLPEVVEPLMHALNHQRANKPSVLGDQSVDLSGILPDGRA